MERFYIETKNPRDILPQQNKNKLMVLHNWCSTGFAVIASRPGVISLMYLAFASHPKNQPKKNVLTTK